MVPYGTNTLKSVPSHGGIWTPYKIWFVGPNQVFIRKGISIGSAVFAQLTVKCDYTSQWAATFPPKHCPFPLGDWDRHPIHGFLSPPESVPQTASLSVQPFSQGLRTWPTHTHTHTTHSPTDRLRQLVCSIGHYHSEKCFYLYLFLWDQTAQQYEYSLSLAVAACSLKKWSAFGQKHEYSGKFLTHSSQWPNFCTTLQAWPCNQKSLTRNVFTGGTCSYKTRQYNNMNIQYRYANSKLRRLYFC